MLNILHLIPTLEGGGAERQLSMLAAEQSKRGWRIHVAVRRGGVYEKTLRDSGVTIHFLGNHRGPNPLLLTRIYTLVKQIKPDTIHTWLPQMDILGGASAIWNAVPWIMSEGASRLAYKPFGFLTYIRHVLARHADAIIANSAGGAAYWAEKMQKGAFVAKIGNAVDINAIRKAPSGSVSPANDSTPQLLVVGRLASEKAVDIVIQAVQQVSDGIDFQVLIIGDGPLHQEIAAMIKTSGVDNRISLMPFQPDWWHLLKNARALVSMSRHEGQPNVVLETMAGECPLIVSDIPAHREFLDETSAILVPVDNPAALAEAITSLLAAPELASQRAERASRCVSGMTIQAAADAFERVYQRAMNRTKT